MAVKDIITNPYVLGGGAIVAVLLLARGGGGSDAAAITLESQKINTAANVQLGTAALASQTEMARIAAERAATSTSAQAAVGIAAVEAAVRARSIDAARAVEDTAINAGIVTNRDNIEGYKAIANIQAIGRLKEIETTGLVQKNLDQLAADTLIRTLPTQVSLAEAGYRSAKDIATIQGTNNLAMAQLESSYAMGRLEAERDFAVRRLGVEENASRRGYEERTGGSAGRFASSVGSITNAISSVGKLFGF